MQVIFDTVRGVSLDIYNPAQDAGLYSHKTMQDFVAERGAGVVTLSSSEAHERIANAAVTAWQEIDEEAWMYNLECLPPLKWSRTLGAEVFFISEAYTADVHTCCVKLKGRFFSARKRIGTPKEVLVEEVAQAIRPQLELTMRNDLGQPVTVTPVPMRVLASTPGNRWADFLIAPVCTDPFWGDVQALHAFMREHSTDAVFDGANYLTISADSIWSCKARGWA